MNVVELWEKSNCYNHGEYYSSLLPEYNWQGLSDTEYLDLFLSERLAKKMKHTLELGAGSGRGTKIVLKHSDKVTAVEINRAMLDSFECSDENVFCVNEDMNFFVKEQSLKLYDLIFSFWGPYLIRESAEVLITDVSSGARGVFFHAHRGGLEQRIVRETLHKFKDRRYDPDKKTSNEEDAFREVLEKHGKSGRIDYCVNEVLGEARFRSLDFALESFLNFHLGGVFEKRVYLEVARFLENRLKTCLKNQEIHVPSGVKIFSFVKN